MSMTPEQVAQDALEQAVSQIEYLHRKFQETGSGNGVIAQCKQAIAALSLPVDQQAAPLIIPHTLGGFSASFYNKHKCQPDPQDIWNAATRAANDLREQAKQAAAAGEPVAWYRETAAIIHAVFYSAPFILLSPSRAAFFVILITHYFIDRYRMARYVVYAKNWVTAPSLKWADCSATGYHKDTPPWLAFWLLIIADNTMHLSINYAALRWL